MPGGEYDHLALTLFYLRSRCTIDEICLTFGITSTTVSTHIKRNLNLIATKLPNNALGRITWPSLAEIDHYCSLVNNQWSLLPDMFGFIDGCRLSLQSPRCLAEQELFYNGWISAVNIVNFFVWAPDGTTRTTTIQARIMTLA